MVKTSILVTLFMLTQEIVMCQKLNSYTYYYTGGIFGSGRYISHTWTQYDRNYYDALKHGNEKYYYTDGNKELEILWDMGEVKKSTSYYTDGSIKCVNNRYNNRVLEGEQKWYSIDANNNKFLELTARISKKQNKAGEYYSQVDFLEFFDSPSKRKVKYSEINNKREVIVYDGKQEHRLTESGGKLISAKTLRGEIKNGRLINFIWDNSSKTKIIGDTMFVYRRDNEFDSSVFSFVNLTNWNVDFSTYESVTAQTYEFVLSYEVPIANATSKKGQILALKPYSWIYYIDDAFVKIFSGNSAQRGWYRTYSCQTNKLKYEAFTNESGLTEFEKWFDESGHLQKIIDTNNITLYYPNGNIQEITCDEYVKSYFENGQIKLDSTSNSSTSYYENGNISREFKDGKYRFYDISEEIQFEGNYNIPIAELSTKYRKLEANIPNLKELDNKLEEFIKKFNKKGNLGKSFGILCQEKLDFIAKLKFDKEIKLKSLNERKELSQIEKYIWFNESFKCLESVELEYKKIENYTILFEQLINSNKKKELNKSLKGVESISEIKKIVGIN